LTLAECHNRPLNDIMSSLLAEKSPETWIAKQKHRTWATRAQIEHYLDAGGMPGICFNRDELVRRKRWSSHLDTVLARDLPLLLKTKLTLSKLHEVFQLMARAQAAPLNLMDIARRVGLSRPPWSSYCGCSKGSSWSAVTEELFFARIMGLPAMQWEPTVLILVPTSNAGYLANSFRNSNITTRPHILLKTSTPAAAPMFRSLSAYPRRDPSASSWILGKERPRNHLKVLHPLASMFPT